MLTRKQKEEIVEKLQEKINQSKTILICDYKGMKVSDMHELRSELRKNGIFMEVIKKTLIQKALNDAKIQIDARKLEGQLALVHGGEDEISAPKSIYDFSKKNENLKILAGALEKEALNGQEIINLAKLPTKEELLAKLVGSIKAPISGFVNVLSGNLRNFVYVLNAIKESREEK